MRRAVTGGADPLPVALAALTLVSGCVDAVSLLALGHVFTANMTGNVVILGLATAGADGFSATASLTSLLAFLAGAVMGGRIAVHARTRRSRVLVTLAAESAAAAAAAGVAALIPPDAEGRRPLVIAVVAIGMGLQNAIVRMLAVPDLTTTVLTRTLTGLAAESTLGGGANPRALRRLSSVLAIFVGACAGAVLLRYLAPGWILLGVAVCVALIATGYAFHPASCQER
ncbi:membrane protein [Sphaerisporangium melleum]|uniref:Membrane protein n=1 Tax=Sphaerisporangium melleum TaxID=321316 RepID=A0A917R503_9ACTN|nr:YoaK family protein [Sphaerisporangium melleum]GGK89438.1 membrane protein [Sphaerisporangium melleum]GII72499.1 membrane protein [Sphaerisporangium melleum]